MAYLNLGWRGGGVSPEDKLYVAICIPEYMLLLKRVFEVRA